MKTSEMVLSIKHLQLNFGEKQVLRNVSFNVFSGEIIGYLGANGAGKSSTIKTILGVNENYSGEIEIFGHEITATDSTYKMRMGYVPEDAAMYDQLTPFEYLGFVGTLYAMEEEVAQDRGYQLLEMLQMKDVFHQRMDSFSKGMRQKVLIVSSLLHNPDILFLDEPLNGLDVESVRTVKNILKELSGQGKVIFFSSHILEVVENIADRVIILENGRTVIDQTVQSIKKTDNEKTLEMVFRQVTQSNQVASAVKFAQIVNEYNQVSQANV